jgi:hypothetical protein
MMRSHSEKAVELGGRLVVAPQCRNNAGRKHLGPGAPEGAPGTGLTRPERAEQRREQFAWIHREARCLAMTLSIGDER